MHKSTARVCFREFGGSLRHAAALSKCCVVQICNYISLWVRKLLMRNMHVNLILEIRHERNNGSSSVVCAIALFSLLATGQQLVAATTQESAEFRYEKVTTQLYAAIL